MPLELVHAVFTGSLMPLELVHEVFTGSLTPLKRVHEVFTGSFMPLELVHKVFTGSLMPLEIAHVVFTGSLMPLKLVHEALSPGQTGSPPVYETSRCCQVYTAVFTVLRSQRVYFESTARRKDQNNCRQDTLLPL